MFRVEEGRAGNVFLERTQGSENYSTTVSMVLIPSQSGVSADVLDARATDHPRGAGGQGETVESGNLGNRNSGALDFLGDRCTATIAGPSGCHEQGRVNFGTA